MRAEVAAVESDAGILAEREDGVKVLAREAELVASLLTSADVVVGDVSG